MLRQHNATIGIFLACVGIYLLCPDFSNPSSNSTDSSKKIKNAVFEGGGIRGIAHVGALTRIQEKGIIFERVAGTSAGSMIAALYAAGYQPHEMKQILTETDFSVFLDDTWSDTFSLINHYGIYRGDKLYEWLYGLLKRRNVTDFDSIRIKDLKIIASDLTHKELLIYDKQSYPKMLVAEAVRRSMAIPLYFQARRDGERIVVDGGILSNYPLWVFHGQDSRTMGFKLVSRGEKSVPHAPNSLPEYLAALLGTMLEGRDKEDQRQIGWAETIHIPTGNVSSTKFALTQDDKDFLYESGYAEATRFLDATKQRE